MTKPLSQFSKRRNLVIARRGSGLFGPRGRVERRFRSSSIGRKPTVVILVISRVECLLCGVIRQIEAYFADPRRSYTYFFECFALEASRCMTMFDIVLHLGVGCNLFNDIQKRDFSRRYAKPKLQYLCRIAIDEIAVAKGNLTLNIVMDQMDGALASLELVR